MPAAQSIANMISRIVRIVVLCWIGGNEALRESRQCTNDCVSVRCLGLTMVLLLKHPQCYKVSIAVTNMSLVAHEAQSLAFLCRACP